MPGDDRLIKIESMLGVKHGPQVKLSWGKESGLLSTKEAREHAMRILEAADAADSDAFIYHFMHNTVGAEPQQVAALIVDFRRFRVANSDNIKDTLDDKDLTGRGE